MAIFTTQRKVVWGRGTISHLEHIAGTRALVVTDDTMANLGVAAKTEDYLKKGGLAVQIFDEVEPEPSINTVNKMLEQHRAFNPDVIIGLGGGSSMDASKAFRIFFEHPDLTFEGVRFFGGPPKTPVRPFTKTAMIGIPSTSGTGSEASFSMVITDPTIPAKCSIPSPENIPDIAILDPDIPDSMPKQLRAHTGLDALTHAIAAYASGWGSNFSRAYALQATILTMKYLPLSCTQDDQDAKEQVHYAANMAGSAFSNGPVGVDHVIATLVGGGFHVAHGLACGIALPYAIRFNANVAGEQYTELARAVGYNGNDQSGAVDYLIQRVIDIRKQLETPESYREVGVPEDAYRDALQGFVEKSFGFPMMAANPRQCTPEELQQLYEDCYYGNYNIS